MLKLIRSNTLNLGFVKYPVTRIWNTAAGYGNGLTVLLQKAQ